MKIFTKLSAPLCLLFVFLCLKTAFSSSIHASSFSTTHLCSHEEALALLQFKTSFSINYTASDPYYCGDHFYTKPNYSKIESWKEGIDCCSWDGVSCDNVTGHVIALNLSCSFLYGTFPSNSTLFFLRNLQSLNLALNDFRLSKIPSEISQFTRLKHLDVSSFGFSGQVPREIAHLPKNLVHNLSEVRELVLSGVNMTSVNPRFFMNLSSSLTTLRLFHCQLRGNFPNSIFRFPNLNKFSLGGKGNLTIDLPSSNWSSPLQYLVLGVMHCGGRLQESIGDLKSLQVLRLTCNLEGSIPTFICNLRQLTVLYLDSNNLSGQIPSSIANLTQLSHLVLSDNQFSGPIPFHAIRPITLMEIYHLGFQRVVDYEISTYMEIKWTGHYQVLVLRSNKFHGSVQSTKESPSFLRLRVLDLSNNDFLGPLPVRYIENFKAMMDLYRDEGSPEYMNVYSYQYSLVVTWKGFDYELQGILTVFSSIHLSNNMEFDESGMVGSLFQRAGGEKSR
ncbi:hypothetical protein SLEP1_g46321 [Rubroshorea leprosula]|uniref:Leucine-rich repeat-containing N-terminal plant-type domain-containing protein n=1 Tax=Rubroshorea leprosula TaxID=152421 RepID=A0AAV5LPA1_9ROSI|nr:hypothetical protein SLEP1_g46321 [Rubroshorea leprosula]